VSGKGPTEHVLPGGIGTFSICHVADAGARTAVKPELITCAPAGKPEPDTSGYARYAGAPFALWSESVSRESASASRGGHWTLPYGGRASGAPTSSSSRHNQATERKGYMDAVSRSSRGFDDDDNDGEEFTRREASSSLKELTVRTDGKGSGSGSDQRPNTPRSKHSATEQRRRSKINDRFQILRDLIPHSDQKRDKASFLLEVIEYIRFLQEKVHKFEASYPEWNQDNSKLMPWANAYFRSFWKQAENKGINGDTMPDPVQVMKNGASSPPAFTFPAGGAATVSAAPSPMEASVVAGFPYKSSETSKSYSHVENATSEAQAQPQAQVRTLSQWMRPAAAEECSTSRDMLNEHEELTIDEGTISLSSNYSQELLTVLSQALQSSGIDLSQASISVQINLGKRASNKRSDTTGTAYTQEHKEATSDNHAKRQEEPLHAPKRRKSDNNS
jgi:hypothetical protein